MLLVWREMVTHKVFQISGLRIVALVLLFMGALPLRAQEPAPPCILEIPVYGPLGDRLPFHVKRVSPVQNKSLNLLAVPRDGVKTTSSGDRILFSSGKIVGRALEVTLESSKGTSIKTNFIVTSCRLRRSLFFGQSGTGVDASGIAVTGHLSGCKFDGDWWVRAAPAFGGHDRVHVIDGYVQSDGSFWLVLGDYGVRHHLIVGKGKDPIKVMGFDVTAGKKTDVGAVDLTHLCPN